VAEGVRRRTNKRTRAGRDSKSISNLHPTTNLTDQGRTSQERNKGFKRKHQQSARGMKRFATVVVVVVGCGGGGGGGVASFSVCVGVVLVLLLLLLVLVLVLVLVVLFCCWCCCYCCCCWCWCCC